MPIEDVPLQEIACSPDLLSGLRAATADAHRQLDASFGSLDLSRRDHLESFLCAHLTGLRALFPLFSEFVECTLRIRCPDLIAMLEEDLQSLGIAPAGVPAAPVVEALHTAGAAAGAAYVVCGSRLGLEVIRREGYWTGGEAYRSRYMDDDMGRACWKAIVPWLRDPSHSPKAQEEAIAAALASFESFAHAFAVSVGNVTALEANG